MRLIPLLISFCVFSVLSSEFKELMAGSSIHTLIWYQINNEGAYVYTHTWGGGEQEGQEREEEVGGDERRTKEEEVMYYQTYLKSVTLTAHIKLATN